MNTIVKVAELTEFFGTSLDEVDPKIVMLASRIEPKPEWLRGKSKIEQLPRFTDKCLPYIYKYRHFLRQSELTIRLAWIVETLKFPWSVRDDGIYFENKSEHMYFVYRWGPPH